MRLTNNGRQSARKRDATGVARIELFQAPRPLAEHDLSYRDHVMATLIGVNNLQECFKVGLGESRYVFCFFGEPAAMS
jgi:hypothetical protein